MRNLNPKSLDQSPKNQGNPRKARNRKMKILALAVIAAHQRVNWWKIMNKNAVQADVARTKKEDPNVDQTDVAQTSLKVNQKETKSLKKARNQNQRNPKRVRNRKKNLNAGLAVVDLINHRLCQNLKNPKLVKVRDFKWYILNYSKFPSF